MIGLLLLASPYSFSQNVSLSSNGTSPNASAVLDLSNITSGGFLLPCMTTAQLTAQLPNGGAYPNSMLVFCTDDNCFWSYYTGSNTWNNEYCLCSGAPAAPGAITGTASVTNGSIYTYSITAVAGATTYNWTVPSGATIETGAGTNSVTVLMACTAGNVGVSAGNSCGTSAITTKAITISSTTPVTTASAPTGSATICASSTGNVYTVTPVTGASSYTWTVPAAVGTIVGVATNNTITVTAAGSAGTGNITVKVNFSCGAAGPSSPALAVETQTTLSAPVVTGTTPITINSTNNTYSVPAIVATNINSYTWTPSSASLGTITAGATTNACSLTAASSASTTYSMQISENNACGTASTTYPVTVTTCSGTILLDNAVLAAVQTNTLSITTSHANEVILILANGDANSGYSGSTPSVSGGSASAVSHVMTNSYGNPFYTCEVVYGFIANTAATYTITVSETGYNYNYTNAAIALYGFCGTPTIAANVTDITPTYNSEGGSTGQHSTISNSISPTVANSYIVANYYNWDYNTDGTVSWTAPAGVATLESTYHNETSSHYDAGIAGYADAGTGAVTFTLSDIQGGNGNVYAPILECIEVHN